MQLVNKARFGVNSECKWSTEIR